MQTPLIDLLRGGVPALAAFVAAVVVIRIVCRRPALRRLSFALSVAALTGSVALFRALVPAVAPLVDPYLCFLVLFSLTYGAFKVVEVLVVDVLPGHHALHRTMTVEYEGPGADRASHLLGGIRRFFGLIGGGDVNGRAARG